ncbi:MAG: 50S ribosomal protein L25 [Candidatus Scalinduaceae bacterium]
MEKKSLQVEIKKDSGSRKARNYRKSGLIPAILYGHKQENQKLLLNGKEFIKILNSGAKMVNLKWDGSEEISLVKNVQFDTFGKEILHVDFIRVDLTEIITTHVSVVLHGTSPGVKEGGILEHTMKEIEIECLPTEILNNIRVDISELNIGKPIHIKDIELPSNIKILENPDAIVASVHFAVEEKEVLEEELVSEPEVITTREAEVEEAENKD